MSFIDRQKKNWKHPGNGDYPKSIPSKQLVWTQTSLYCLASNRDCYNCPVTENLETIRGFAGGCKMPFAVQSLLDEGIGVSTVMLAKGADRQHYND